MWSEPQLAISTFVAFLTISTMHVYTYTSKFLFTLGGIYMSIQPPHMYLQIYIYRDFEAISKTTTNNNFIVDLAFVNIAFSNSTVDFVLLSCYPIDS